MYSGQLPSRVGNLKVHSQRRDSPALRMQLGSTISSMDLQPPGMSPSAILIIRKISDPMPGILRPDSSEIYGPGNNNKDSWQIALRSQLSDLYRKASRPAKAVFVDEQDAVLFRDHPELMACFCRDVIAGSVTKKWWWKSHYGQSMHTMSPSVMVARLFVETPGSVPAVINMLAEWHCAIKLIRVIDASSARQITLAVLHEFGLAGLDDKLRNIDSSSHGLNRLAVDQSKLHLQTDCFTEATGSISYDGAGISNIYSTFQFEVGSSAALPWLNHFGDEIWAPDLSKEQLGLLGIARLLQSSPMTLRKDYFQDQVVRWWLSPGQVDMQHHDPVLHSILTNHALIEKTRNKADGLRSRKNTEDTPKITIDVQNVEYEGATDEVTKTPERFDKPVEENVQDSHNYDNHSAISPSGDIFETDHENKIQEVAENNYFESAPVLSTQINESRRAEHSTSEIANSHKLKKISESDLFSETEDASEQENEIFDVDKMFSDTYFDTKLGGLLYLINLLKQLNLPECLSEKWKLDQQVSRWALLDAISRALLGGHYLAYRQDPVWRALAGLDHRRLKTAVGKGFQDHSDYYMPVEWFDYIACTSPRQYYWALHKNRLRIWSEVGIVVERKLTDIDTVECQVIEELRRYSQDVSRAHICAGRYGHAPVANRRQLAVMGIDLGFTRLLSLVLPAIRKYLQDVLALSTVTPRTLLNKLHRCNGRIYVSSSHIDLMVDMSSITLAIRRAGLDQDPGWLPLYGRVVLFHFT